MALRMIHPGIDGEGVAASRAQFDAMWAPQGWELVPDGTPAPGEWDYRPHKAQPVPVPESSDLVMVDVPADGTEAEVTGDGTGETLPPTDDTPEPAAPKPPRSSRRKPAADTPPAPDAATNSED